MRHLQSSRGWRLRGRLSMNHTTSHVIPAKAGISLIRQFALLILISFGLAACSTTKEAHQAPPVPAHGPVPFAAFDLDGNGQISEEEFNTVRGERMAKKMAQRAAKHGDSEHCATCGACLGHKDGKRCEGKGQKGKGYFGKGEHKGHGQGHQCDKASGEHCATCPYCGKQIHTKSCDKASGKGAKKSGKKQGKDFSFFDLNGDGKLLKPEFYEARRKIKSRGRVAVSSALKQRLSDQIFDNFDANGNGEVTPEEYSSQYSGKKCSKHQ